jgi:hypothetical protein
MLGIEDKKYKLFGDLKKYVITKAQKEFSEKKNGFFASDINFNFDPIKTGRKVTGLKFYIFEQSTKPKKEKKPPTLPPKTGTDQEKSDTPEIQEMLDIGVQLKKATALLEQHGAEKIIEALKFTAEEERKNPAGFFISILNNGWNNSAGQKKAQKKIKDDKARKKVLAEREQARRESAISSLEKTFRITQKKEFLKSLTESKESELLEEAKKENPDLEPMIKALDSPFCGNFLVSKIPDYEENKQIFINAGLQKMGLISGEENDTEK